MKERRATRLTEKAQTLSKLILLHRLKGELVAADRPVMLHAVSQMIKLETCVESNAEQLQRTAT